MGIRQRSGLSDGGPRRRSRLWRGWAVVASAIGLMLAGAIPGLADPPDDDAAANPFPEMDHITAWYDRLDPDEFLTPDQAGVWFLTPSGLNCGIWVWGSFGCTGDIPGAPAGDHHIAWFNGNRSVHHGWTAAIQFPAGHAQRTLPPRSYLTYESTSCATMPDGNTYCQHGENKLLITPQGTWFKAWDDRRSQVCNAYGSCLPPW